MGLNLWNVGVPLLNHVVWIWATVPVALILWHFYSWKLPFRKLLLRFWLNSRGRRLHFKLPGAVDQMLEKALQQVEDAVYSRRFHHGWH